ncbi:MAG: hypothetical protein RLZZ293_1349 [Pseudomonadota bacterium]|jgi:putative ABC transport system ATP-binding protein
MQNKQNLVNLARYLLVRDKKFFSLIIGYGVIVALLNLALPLSIQVLITSIIYTAQITPVLILGLVLLFLISFAALLSVLQKFLIEIYKRRSFSRIASDILLKIIYSDQQSFLKHSSSGLSSRYFEIFNLQTNASELIVEGFLVFLTILVSFILSSFYHPYFLILNLVILVIIWGSWKIFSSRASHYAIERSEAKFALFGWIDDVFKMNTFFKSNTGKNYALNKGAKLIRDYIKARCRYWNVSFAQLIILSLLYVATTVALVTIGSILVIYGQLSLGQLVAAEILYTTSLYGVSKLSIYYDKYYNLIASLDEMGHLFVIDDERLGRIDNSNTLIQTSLTAEQIISFNDVIYQDYFGNKYIFNFQLQRKQSVLLLTNNQNTKVILNDLLNHYLTPNSGYIEFNNIHLSDYDQHYLRDQIYLVNNSDLFACSISEFLEFGMTPQQEKYTNEILAITGLNIVIHRLESKYQTNLLANGYPLTKEQVILLKVVKAILLNPQMIIITDILEQIDSNIHLQLLEYIQSTTSITIVSIADNAKYQAYYQKVVTL